MDGIYIQILTIRVRNLISTMESGKGQQHSAHRHLMKCHLICVRPKRSRVQEFKNSLGEAGESIYKKESVIMSLGKRS